MPRRPHPTGHPPSVTGAGPLRVRARAGAWVSGGAAGPAALAAGSGAGSTLGSAAWSGGRRRNRTPNLSAAAMTATHTAPSNGAVTRERGASREGRVPPRPGASREIKGSAAAGRDGKGVARSGRHGGRRGEAGPWRGGAAAMSRRHLLSPSASLGAGRAWVRLYTGPLARFSLL